MELNFSHQVVPAMVHGGRDSEKPRYGLHVCNPGARVPFFARSVLVLCLFSLKHLLPFSKYKFTLLINRNNFIRKWVGSNYIIEQLTLIKCCWMVRFLSILIQLLSKHDWHYVCWLTSKTFLQFIIQIHWEKKNVWTIFDW